MAVGTAVVALPEPGPFFGGVSLVTTRSLRAPSLGTVSMSDIDHGDMERVTELPDGAEGHAQGGTGGRIRYALDFREPLLPSYAEAPRASPNMRSRAGNRSEVGADSCDEASGKGSAGGLVAITIGASLFLIQTDTRQI
ncbi:hypothetical protein ACFXD5_38560 [Streptomyces sp. NPDC059385]|uniref:hypothetical protein n=1 Tax=Streptomyces sp. NPDC059385 TaxID=3346817 RepID=UPI003680C054